MAFSATECAFEGFRVARRTPLTILIWAAAYILFMAVVLALMGGSFIALMATATELQGVTNPTPEDFAPLWAAYAGVMWIMPLALVFSAVLYTAALRVVLRPEEKGFGYMRLGMDEVRVFVVTVVLSVLAFLASLIIFGLAGVLAGLASVAAGDAGGLVGLVLMLVAVAAFFWLAVRFCLALPITVAERRFAIFDSWNMTKGKALPLFGMTLIIIVMAIVVSILASIIILPLMFFTGNISELAAMQGADFGQIMSAMGPAIIIYILSNSVISALSLAIFMAPYAAAYRDIRGGGAPLAVEPAPSL
ncbi:MAG: hypothetical protein ACK4FB_12295 [Brevundimonas sp.]|uniref:hypothetical protein n=1 Tax=Brevundimonas sp. TaxID=1871086 RepID=UPI00391CFAD1